MREVKRAVLRECELHISGFDLRRDCTRGRLTRRDNQLIYGHKRRLPNANRALRLLRVRKAMRFARLRVDCRVPTYIYETTDPSKPVRTFEIKQSVHDDPLRADPETGEAARRIISAGYSVLVRGKSIGPSVGSVGSHSGCD
jgi:predicted nucleic acid-binding Zn ribbon protein